MKSRHADVGARVRELRLAKKWSQAVLAEKVGVVKATISMLENNRIGANVDRLEQIASALGVQTFELLEN